MKETLMTTNFMAALQSKAQSIQAERAEHEKRLTPDVKAISDQVPAMPFNPNGFNNPPDLNPVITCDIMTDRKRIDLFFSFKPKDSILDSLRDAGFHFRPSDKAWYHQDSDMNRAFLRANFDLDLDPSEAPIKLLTPIVESIPFSSVQDFTSPLDCPEGYSKRYDRFKKQVNELLADMKIDAADLMLEAINCLHKTHFNQN